MREKNKRKRAVTLIEIIIVIFLIGLIGGVLAYNLKGSLDEGKSFKSEQGAQQVRNILLLEVAKGRETMESAVQHWQDVVRRSPLVGKPGELIKDGWGEEYLVAVDNEDIIVTSKRIMENKNQEAE